MKSAARTVTFLVEFEEPSREFLLSTPCPFCEVPAGQGCVTYSGKPCGFHHERIAVALNMEPAGHSAYRIK